jgi:ankyrin repeat protein
MNSYASLEIVQFLVNKGFEINSQTEVSIREYAPNYLYDFSNVYIPEGWTPLMFANRNPNGFEINKYLINKGANLNLVNNLGDSLLHLMCGCTFDKEKLIYYLEYGANLNLLNKDRKTPLNYYMSNKDVQLEIIHIFEKYGLDFNHKDNEKRNYLEDYSKYRISIPNWYNKEIADYFFIKIHPKKTLF